LPCLKYAFCLKFWVAEFFIQTAIGLFPDVGGSYYLSHLKPNFSTGLFIGLTGHRLNKTDLIFTGIGTEFVPSDQVQGFVAALKSRTWNPETAPWMQVEQIIKKFQRPLTIGVFAVLAYFSELFL
jgi:enoyl-CoA hydratase/carnithine racemase